jgi:transposase
VKAYSVDLREKIVEAVMERGVGKSEAAHNEGASLSSSKTTPGWFRKVCTST